MKIRTDFVTNSSSSSFIVAFSKKPESVEDVKRELFGNREWYRHPYYDEVYSANQVAETVFNDIKNQEVTLKEIIEAIDCGWFAGRVDYDDERFKLSNNKYDWEAYEKANQEIAKGMAEEFIKENNNGVIYTFNYGDEDGTYFSALEHGTLFDNVPHIKVSCH